MPVAPKFQVEHIQNLALQMKRAPEQIRKKQMSAAHQLILDIDYETLYPLDYIVYRITQYRPDALEQPMIVGNALIGDLVALIATVSRSLDMPATGMLSIDQAAKFLNVSTRTISRLRREGLVFYWVVTSGGSRWLGCSIESLQNFKKLKKDRIQTAVGFSRLSNLEQREIVDAALAFKGSGRTLNDVATELSNQSQRGVETIRMLLQSNLETNSALKHPPPLTKRDARIIERARALGIPWEPIKNKYNRSADALRKAVIRLRASRLKRLDILHLELDVFQRSDAEEVILGVMAVQHVPKVLLSINPLELCNLKTDMTLGDEVAITSAMQILRKRADSAIKKLGYAPTVKSLDSIEADLRWAFLLQQQLIIKAIPSSIAVAVQHAGRPLNELPSEKIVALVKHVIKVVGDVCSMLDSSKGQTATKTPASVLDRALSTLNILKTKDIAAAKQKPPLLFCPFHDTVPWSYLIPRTM
jgi:RNA polymerase primary sigma factor